MMNLYLNYHPFWLNCNRNVIIQQQAHEELDKQKRKLEAMVHTLQDGVSEKEGRVHELQNSLDKTMEDVARLTLK